MDERKEQAKVREKILKVFRARAQSPGGGPAIIVSEESHQSRRKAKGLHSNTKTNEFPKYELDDSDDFLLSDGNATPVSIMEKGRSIRDKLRLLENNKKDPTVHQEMGPVKRHTRGHSSHQQKKSQQREKRLKSRAERDKNRTQKQHQVNPLEREEFRKHVKKAREITSQSNLADSHSDDQVFAAITCNRLTRQAGIYNKGKKSSRLFRDPLHVSQWVTAAVEKDMHRIVDVKDSTTLHRGSSVESLPAVTNTPVTSARKGSSASTGCTKTTRSSGTTKESFPTSAKCYSPMDQTPQVLDIQDISAQLLSSLDVKQLFPGREYAAEIRHELQKLMKSNCSENEPGTSSAQSIKEYLQSVSSKLTVEAKSCHEHLTEQPRSLKSTWIPNSTPAYIPHATSCVQMKSESIHHSSEKVMQMEVPEATDGNQPSTKHVDVLMSRAKTTFTDNALQLLKSAEVACLLQKHLQRRQTLPSPSTTQPMDLGQVSDRQHESYSSKYLSSCHLDDINAVDQTRYDVRVTLPSYADEHKDASFNSGVFFEDARSRGYRHEEPDHHAGYSRYSVFHDEGIPTDILDHIEMSERMEVVGPSPSLPDPFEHSYDTAEMGRYQERRQRRSTQHVLPHTITRFNRCESDTESSPVWCPSFVSPIQKPKLESPSPPELYPQRMF